MYNPVIIDRLEIIIQSIKMINARMENIFYSADFNKDEYGIMIMDSIAMRLEQIGECMKKIEKLEEGFLLLKCKIDPLPYSVQGFYRPSL